MLAEPVFARGLSLNEGDGAESSPLEAKVETPDSCEEREDIQATLLSSGSAHTG